MTRTGLSQPNASMHLRCPAECGLVTWVRQGRFVHYKLAAKRVRSGWDSPASPTALAWSPLTLTIGFTAIRGSAVGGLALVSQHVINLWFVTRRGMAATAASAGVALGGVVFPPGD